MRGIISMAAPSETCRTAEPYSDTDEHQARTPSPASVEAPKTLYVVSDSSFASMGLSLCTERRSDCGAVLQGGRDESAYKYASYWHPAQDRPLPNTIRNAGYDADWVDSATDGTVYLAKVA